MMEYLSPVFVGFSVFVFGLLIGSFLNVVIYRVPKRESIIFPSSHCPACNVAIKPYDNIPVVSYAVLGGRCRSCRVGISPIYPAVELLVALLYLAVFLRVMNQYPDMAIRFWLGAMVTLRSRTPRKFVCEISRRSKVRKPFSRVAVIPA